MSDVIKWLGDIHTEIIELTFSTGEIGIVFIINQNLNKKNITSRIVVYIPKKGASGSSELKIQEIINLSGISKEQIESIRLIGENHLIELMKMEFEKLGFPVGKPVLFDHFPALIQFLP